VLHLFVSAVCVLACLCVVMTAQCLDAAKYKEAVGWMISSLWCFYSVFMYIESTIPRRKLG
jgi:nitrate reductase gamma subunit